MDEERAKIIAASGSGGSAQGRPPQFGLRFGEIAFGQVPGGPVPALTDDHGRPLVARACADGSHLGSHIWDDSGTRSYCEGPYADE
jgi:hypothetical protein